MALPLTRLLIALWILLVLAGWGLSAAGWLTRPGYLIVFALAAAGAWAAGARFPRPRLRFPRRRLRRLLPALWAVLLAGVVLAGLLYWPNNFDALTYRLPRLLHWLAHHQWHWIHSDFHRLNTRAVNAEWLLAPFALFGGSERWSWIFNAATFATLPGLLFATLTRVGVSPRAAARWMWLLPTAYVLPLQAAGDANDLPGAFLTLAAVALALRGTLRDLLWSALAIALAIGLKVSNAPLALPWLLAAWPSLRILGQRPALAALTALACLPLSFLPIAIANYRHCGDWTGQRLEMSGTPPPVWLCLVTNALRLTAQNSNPPVFPMASAWNTWSLRHLPARYREQLGRYAIEAPDYVLAQAELPLEDQSGTGPFILLLVAAAALVRFRSGGSRDSLRLRLLRWSPWVALLVFSARLSLMTAARLTAPYDLLLPLPFLAGAGAAWLTRARWWHALAVVQMLSALVVIVATPARPLFPALTLLDHLPARLQGSPLVQRAHRIYHVFRERPESLAPVCALLPADPVIGLSINVEPEAVLWRPFLTRRFEHIRTTDTPDFLRARGIQHVVARVYGLAPEAPLALPAWLAAFPLEITARVNVSTLASEPPGTWIIARLRPEHGE